MLGFGGDILALVSRMRRHIPTSSRDTGRCMIDIEMRIMNDEINSA